jgi:hypothetical protein
MIKAILPKLIWHAPVKNFQAVQEEISKAVETADWKYYQEQEWGKTSKFERMDPFNYDIIQEYGMQHLIEEIASAVSVYDPEYVFSEHRPSPKSWLVKYDKGDYAHIHNHYGCHISGAYYYKLEDNNNFFFSNYPSSETAPIDLSEGDLILFPAELQHGVIAADHDSSRIVISFNLY